MVDEQQLLERLLADDAQAYQELVNTYQSSMYAVAVAIAGFQNSDDVVQDSWLSIVRNIKNFQGRSSLKTWLLRITANSAKDCYKQKRREVLVEDLSGIESIPTGFPSNGNAWLAAPYAWHGDTPEALLLEGELCQCLEKTLQSLPLLQRQVFLMRDRHGLELTEIRDELNISISNVRVLLYRARLRVSAMIKSFSEDGKC